MLEIGGPLRDEGEAGDGAALAVIEVQRAAAISEKRGTHGSIGSEGIGAVEEFDGVAEAVLIGIVIRAGGAAGRPWDVR